MAHTQRDTSARKSLPSWKGPHQVVEMLSEHRYMVENVVTLAWGRCGCRGPGAV